MQVGGVDAHGGRDGLIQRLVGGAQVPKVLKHLKPKRVPIHANMICSPSNARIIKLFDHKHFMSAGGVLGIVNLFFAGILAGEELVIRYGVRGPVARLDQVPSIQLRQAIIYSLRVKVPVIFFSTLLSAVTATVLDGFGPGFVLRCAALVALLVWLGFTLPGTAPINAAALEWKPDAPPPNWRAMVSRWERFDTVRTWAALTAFVLMLAAMAAQPT
jgi:uncharacterized membrane protein